MISMGTVWDRTKAVIAGRLGILLSLALVFLFAPTVVQASVDAMAETHGQPGSGTAILSLMVSLLATVGTLAITAVATDPNVDRPRAAALGIQRLGPAIGIVLLLTLAALLIVMPGVLLIVAAGLDVTRAQLGQAQANLNLGMAAAAGLYFILFFALMFWVTARFVPLLAVIVNERRGLGAIRRSFELTRGSTWKLIGVLILFGIVCLVAVVAATNVAGLITRLIVGPDHPGLVALAVAIATAALTALFGIIQSVFSGQFYLAARDVKDAA